MKKAIVALSVMFLSVAVFAQNAQKKAEDFIKFKEATYDFGKIKQGTPVTHDFVFKNISNQPIVIEYASASCGCTTPTWPQGAVAKAASDKITAGFNAAATGPFNKSITIKVAGVEQPLVITITGEVLSAEDYAKHEATKKKPGSK
ncbi:MAG TPA: DUF1573 domain-containing protein [Chitinophagaceae bacterium]|nr:DUF1573 domain-containing protein [Chitinophagaceae bacterium]